MKVFSEEEIEFFLAGDRRAVDKHILLALNNIVANLASHSASEEIIKQELKAIGGFESIKARAEYVDSIIQRNNKISAMAEKVAQSVIIWAVIAALGMVFVATWDGIISSIRTALHIKGQ